MLFISSIDSSNLGKYNKNFKVNFTVSDNYSKNAWAVPRKGKSGKKQQPLSGKKKKLVGENARS